MVCNEREWVNGGLWESEITIKQTKDERIVDGKMKCYKNVVWLQQQQPDMTKKRGKGRERDRKMIPYIFVRKKMRFESALNWCRENLLFKRFGWTEAHEDDGDGDDDETLCVRFSVHCHFILTAHTAFFYRFRFLALRARFQYWNSFFGHHLISILDIVFVCYVSTYHP